jgi:hypothetical protein
MWKSVLPFAGGALLLAATDPAWAQTLPEPTETIALTSAPPYLATGLLYLSKADTNAPGLRNPILLAEGFDANNNMDWETLYELVNRENLVDDLQDFGRDLLILNFGDSTADILANSALTETAINHINSNRFDLTDKFTAVGVSIGGLTTRLALADMANHNVDTWISFDAPHKGANIPLGVQEYIEFFAPHQPAANDFLTILDQPASRQMLLLHHSHPDGLAGGSMPEQADFNTVLDAAGYPANCKTIAISNGSGFGEKFQFSPGEKIIHWTDSGGFFDPSINADIHALPRTSATVFSGLIKLSFITVDSATVNAYHPLSFDNAPGGGRPTFIDVYTNIPPDQISSDDYCSTTNHCFIPTVSALGIPLENLESNLSTHAEIIALSPFDEIHYAVTNERHVEINARNKRWLMRAVLEGHDSDSDGWDDYQEYLVGTAYDSAASQLAIELAMDAQPSNSSLRIAWAAYPNTRYHIWHTEELGLPWVRIDTVPPTDLAGITNKYEFTTAEAAGFFAVSGDPVDPVLD